MKTIFGLAALVLAAGTVGYLAAGWGSGKAVSLGLPPGPAASTQATQASGTLPSGRALEVWFARGGRLVEALRTHTATPQVATAALDALLAGPTRAERTAGLRSEIPRGTRLLGIGERDAPAAAVSEQRLEAWSLFRRGDDQDVADAGQHQRRQRVVDHRLVVDRQQLLADRPGDRMQPGAGPAGKDDALQRMS